MQDWAKAAYKIIRYGSASVGSLRDAEGKDVLPSLVLGKLFRLDCSRLPHFNERRDYKGLDSLRAFPTCAGDGGLGRQRQWYLTGLTHY